MTEITNPEFLAVVGLTCLSVVTGVGVVWYLLVQLGKVDED